MSDIKMSDEDISYVLQYIAGFEPEDIESDDFDIAVNDDQFASFSIVRAAQLGHECIERLTKESAQLKADKAELLDFIESLTPPYIYDEDGNTIVLHGKSTILMGTSYEGRLQELLQKHKGGEI